MTKNLRLQRNGLARVFHLDREPPVYRPIDYRAVGRLNPLGQWLKVNYHAKGNENEAFIIDNSFFVSGLFEYGRTVGIWAGRS